jgi:hypothetical protein
MPPLLQVLIDLPVVEPLEAVNQRAKFHPSEY